MTQVNLEPIRPGFPLRFLLLFFIFVFASLCFFSSGTIESQDGWLYLNVSRNLYYNHEATAAPNEYPTNNVNMNATLGKDGKWRAPGSLGYSLSMVPAVALSDLILRHYGVTPPNHFPLQSDWTVLFFASFTNSFLTAIIALVVLLYAFELGQTRKQAVITSLCTVFLTLLLPLSKEGFAHPLFISGLLTSFYLVKRFSSTRRLTYLLGALCAYLVVFTSYNDAWLIPLPAFGFYFFFLQPKKHWPKYIALATFGALVATVLKPTLPWFIWAQTWMKPKVFVEGVFGLLFSPGKSVFLYSPLLLILPLFWWKIPSKRRIELVAFSLMAGTFLFLYGKAWILGSAGQLTPIWYGGLTWGTRYIAALIPFFMLLVMECVYTLRRIQKIAIVLPLVLASWWVQLIGVSIPYILEYRDLPSTIQINKDELSYYDYASFIPRYSPLITMSREFARKVFTFKDTVAHGRYNVRFYDGFEVPLKTGSGTIRGFRSEGHISFNLESASTLKNIGLRVNNIPDTKEATAQATLQVIINGTQITTLRSPANTDVFTQLTIPEHLLQAGKNSMDMVVTYNNDLPRDHVLYVTQLIFDSQNINLASLDYPDVSNVGYKTTKIPYHYFGNREDDPWKQWYLRARINERTFDFWWIKNLYYWDRPQQFIWALFSLDLFVIGSSAIVVWKLYRYL